MADGAAGAGSLTTDAGGGATVTGGAVVVTGRGAVVVGAGGAMVGGGDVVVVGGAVVVVVTGAVVVVLLGTAVRTMAVGSGGGTRAATAAMVRMPSVAIQLPRTATGRAGMPRDRPAPVRP